MHTRIFSFLSEFDFFSVSQYGFLPGLSVNDAVIHFLETCYNALNNKECTISVFLDFSKAFDVVDREVLCAKLDHLGIRSNVLNWCRSYLSDRKQTVMIDGSSSQHNEIPYGVPQGSVLGPLFFLIY